MTSEKRAAAGTELRAGDSVKVGREAEVPAGKSFTCSVLRYL